MRTAWLVLGIALFMLLALEFTYRAKAAIRRALRPKPEMVRPPHPYDDSNWWAAWQNGGAQWQVRVDPYRGIWGVEGSSQFVTLDSLGRRWTYDPAPSLPKPRRIFLFGGSAMFGYTARDPHTIPSRVAEELHRGGAPLAEVVNLAQSTFNLTQGLNTLVLELRAGRVPDIVVFMDGNNEIAPAFNSGRVGTILNQDRWAARLEVQSPAIAAALTENLGLLARLERLFQTTAPPVRGDTTLCPEIASQYVNLAFVIRGLCTQFDFDAIFFWQPMLATTNKKLTPWEKSISSPPAWRRLVAVCSEMVHATVQNRGLTGFHPLDMVFDADTSSVYLDDYGHIAEAGNAVVAGAIVDHIMPLLAPTSRTSP